MFRILINLVIIFMNLVNLVIFYVLIDWLLIRFAFGKLIENLQICCIKHIYCLIFFLTILLLIRYGLLLTKLKKWTTDSTKLGCCLNDRCSKSKSKLHNPVRPSMNKNMLKKRCPLQNKATPDTPVLIYHHHHHHSCRSVKVLMTVLMNFWLVKSCSCT